MKKTKKYVLVFFMGLITFSTFNSCVNTKRLAYFSNIPRDTVIQMRALPKIFTIAKNDLLQISIVNLDPQTMALLNGGASSSLSNPGLSGTAISSGAGANGNSNGYLVSEQGTITLPLLGKVKAEGLTKEQLEVAIKTGLIDKKIALDPIVTVHILNYKITVLGEVNHPGVFPVPNEKITLPEVLGLAGDLTPYGKRDNALLIRSTGDKLIYRRFSLNNDQIFDKDFYYLQNGDVIYVEPNNAKAGLTDRSTQVIPIMLSALSLLVVTLTFILHR